MRELSVTVWDSETLDVQRVENIYFQDSITITPEDVHKSLCARTGEDPNHWEIVPEATLIRPEGGVIFLQETPQHPGFNIRAFSTYSFIVNGENNA